MTRRRFLQDCAWGSAALAGAAGDSAYARGENSRPPNILFLLTDDQRWDALGAAGNPIIQTPHLDRLAAAGVRFANNFVTTSICAVSRASFFTGQYARCHGIHGFSRALSESQHAASYPLLLREAGYRTGFIGKYGVGRELPAETFDYFEGFAGQGRYFPEGESRHLTRIMGDRALEFLDAQSGDQPFCLSVSFKAPHVQDGEAPYFLNDPAFDGLYQDITIPAFKKNAPRYHEALPEFLQRDYEGRIRWERRFSTPEKYQESVKRYYRLISGVDAQVGRLMEALDARGWDDNTVVIYASDNGFYLGERGLAGKWLMHEESIRTPLVIRDPRAAGSQGSVRPEMTLNIDCAPTILNLAGIEAPPSMQGRNLRPLIEGQQNVPWRGEWFYEHLFDHRTIPKTEGVRTERWKYTRYLETDPLYEELYDLESDPQEEHNLAEAVDYREQLSRMQGRSEAWKEKLESWEPPEPWRDPE